MRLFCFLSAFSSKKLFLLSFIPFLWSELMICSSVRSSSRRKVVFYFPFFLLFFLRNFTITFHIKKKKEKIPAAFIFWATGPKRPMTHARKFNLLIFYFLFHFSIFLFQILAFRPKFLSQGLSPSIQILLLQQKYQSI